MGMIMKNGVPYAQGSEIPKGGTKGQVLAKASDLDGDTEWKDEEGGGGETPTLDAVLRKGNNTERSATFTDSNNGTQAEIYSNGTYMTGNGTEGMRQFSVSQNGIRAVDNLVGTITPKFVVPFEPSGEDQVAMSDAVKASFKKALGIANDSFVFDVDSDQFTPDPDNPDGKHYGMTITSPTYDELLAMLQTDTFVYARLLYNSGKAYEIMQLFHNMNSIYGRYFDVEFPQKRLQFASAYVNKRTNNETYFGTYQDYISGSIDAYTKTETDNLLNAKQETLVNGTNIKTVNGESLLGPGNLQIGDSVVKLYDVTNMPTAPTIMADVANNRLCYIDGHWLVTGYDKMQVSSGKFIIYADYNDERVTYVFAIQGESLTSVISRTVSKKPEFGISIEVGKEKWQGTYTDETGKVYQVYSKMVYIPALPATAGITTYEHGVSNIKQILNIYGFTTDGFVLNAPRQVASDNIAIYQASKTESNKTFSIEVGKDRSSKKAYVVIVYAKNN